MLEIARRKITGEASEVRQRIQLIEGDMRDFTLDRKPNLIIIPYRAFLHLHTVEDQRRCLACIHDRLADNGKLVFNIFDPNLEVIAGHMGLLGQALKRSSWETHPDTGRPVLLWETRHYDPTTQMLENLFIFEELDEQGHVIRKSYNPLTLRFVYRYEMQHLLELCHFRVESLHGGFRGETFNHGGEQVWTATKA